MPRAPSRAHASPHLLAVRHESSHQPYFRKNHAFTKVMKHQAFKLIYIDLFAGTGTQILSDNTENPMSGSALRALNVRDRSFDRFVFVENDARKIKELKKLEKEHPGRKIEIYEKDANEVLSTLELGSRYRGVIFLDPYAIEIKYETLKYIARLQSLDTWLLFPTSAVSRILSKRKKPEQGERKLNELFGSKIWETVYDQTYSTLNDTNVRFRRRGPGAIINLYKNQLSELFKNRLLNKSLTLRNTKNAPLFELMFCTGSPRGIDISHNIAKHIIEYESSRDSRSALNDAQRTLEL